MLRLDNVTFNYDNGHTALKNINFSTDMGNCIGVIGENGSGKTTLFKLLVAILKPNKGNVLIDEKELKYDKGSIIKLRQRVNMMLQNPDDQIFFSDAYDELAFALRNLGVDELTIKYRIEEVLKSLDAKNLLEKPTHYLSYGQKKRICIAAVLCLEPNIILLDEPTSGLDPRVIRSFKLLISNIIKTKKVIISSHDIDLVYELCDYIYVLNNGTVICEGDKREVFNNPDIVERAGLELPWLTLINQKLNLPLFESRTEIEGMK